MEQYKQLDQILDKYIELLRIRERYSLLGKDILKGLDGSIKLIELTINKICSDLLLEGVKECSTMI